MELRNINFKYKGHSQNTLENISMNIKQGTLVLLCGQSGCGKTTLTRVINGLCPEFYYGTLTGTYIFEKEDMMSMTITEKSSRIGSVFQDPDTQFFSNNGFDEIVLGAEQKAIESNKILDALADLNQLLDVTDLYDKTLFQMSSGEKQKIAIASVCLLSPKILVLDEPSANLDDASINKLGCIIEVLKRSGMTVILSEHRFHYVREIIDEVYYLKKGRIEKHILGQNFRMYHENALLKMGLRTLEEPLIDSQRLKSIVTDDFLSIKNLSFKYQSNEILKQINLRINLNKITVITGQNGRGKTTFLRLLGGILKENSGHISYNGRKINKRRRRSMFFLLEQNGNNQLYSKKVKEEFLIDQPNQKKRTYRRKT